jgi:YVTN family beta-propeller protein
MFSYPWTPVYDPENGNLYSSDSGASNLTVISGSNNTIIATIPIMNYPDPPGVDPANGKLYVTGYVGSALKIVSATTHTVIANATVGSYPLIPVYSPASRDMYVANGGSNNISVISGTSNSVIATIALGGGPESPTYDPANGNLYISSPSTSSVNVIATSTCLYSTNFTASGLPNGTAWSVNVGGGVRNSSTSIVGFNLTNGTYTFNVGPVAGYSAVPGSGTVTVNGTWVTTGIDFYPVPPPPTYLVTFAETGLPNGTGWYLNITGQAPIFTTNTSSAIDLANGTYSYAIATADQRYEPSPATGTFMVRGSSLSESAVFALVSYSVTFHEVVLPPGTNWSVCLNGTTEVSELGNITFTEPNGTYNYTVSTTDSAYEPASYAGSVAVDGAPEFVRVGFISTASTINFTESGLPAGTNWTVTIGGEQLETSASHILFSELNGTYVYTVGVVTGYAASPSSGSVDVNGTPVAVPISFTAIQPTTYTVTFQETGLPTGTNWSVTLATRTIFSSNSTISFQQPNGSFVYEVGQVAGYTFRTPDPSVFIFGTPVEVTVPFTPVSTPHSSSPTNDYVILAFVAAVVVVALAVIVMLWRRKVPPGSESRPPPARGNGPGPPS